MEINLLAGQNLIKKKNFGDALNIFRSLIKSNNKNKIIYFYLGLVFKKLS